MKLNGAFLAVLGVLSATSGAHAFDTGHHYDLTREALKELGMSEDAIQVAQVENWLVDYYSNNPTRKDLEADLSKLHFDNLNTTTKVRNYWGRLTVNTKKAVEDAAKAKNPMQVVALTGMSLHAVQDFYTHSNWVETHSTFSDAYSTRTWFDVPPPLTATKLVTGTYPNSSPVLSTNHGNYSVGMNHDSYCRPRWDEAYVYAYSASVQWVSAIEKWVSAVDPAVWAQAKKLSLGTINSAMLKLDRVAAYKVSEWVASDGNDGHWKGKGSGSKAEWYDFTVAWASGIDSIFVEHFKNDKWHQALTNNLHGNTPPATPVPSMPSRPLNKMAVRVRTSSIEELPVGLLEAKMDMAGTPDFLGQVTIDGQVFVEAMQINKSTIAPFWWSIKFVDAGRNKIDIVYDLFDEDSKISEVCDINPTVGKKKLEFSLSLFSDTVSGDISGSAGKRLTSEGVKGDNNRARIALIVDSRRLRQ
ncbi:MAG: hypothetical protein QM758_01415 [Armatimonas sp.]